MKKKILLTMLIFLGALTFSGTKEDFEAAFKSYETNQNIEQLEKKLLELSIKTSDEYTLMAKLELASLNISKLNNELAKKYINEVLADKKSTNEMKESAYTMLYAIVSDNNELLNIVHNLIKLNPDEFGYKALEINQNLILGNVDKYKSLYDTYTKSMVDDKKVFFDIRLIQLHIASSKLEEAKKIAENLIKTTSKEGQIAANYYLAKIAFEQEKTDEALNFAKIASILTEGKNYDVEKLIYDIDVMKLDLKNAIISGEKVLKLQESVKLYTELIVLYELVNDETSAETKIKEFKTKLGEVDSKKVNITLSHSFLSIGVFAKAEKYALKALEEDKLKEANATLASIYASAGNKNIALQYLALAKANNVKGIEDLEKQINELK